MRKTIGESWYKLPNTSFILQCQHDNGMRIVKSASMPTSSNAGYLLKKGDVVDTDIQDFLAGTCWVKSQSGENRDYEYEART